MNNPYLHQVEVYAAVCPCPVCWGGGSNPDQLLSSLEVSTDSTTSKKHPVLAVTCLRAAAKADSSRAKRCRCWPKPSSFDAFLVFKLIPSTTKRRMFRIFCNLRPCFFDILKKWLGPRLSRSGQNYCMHHQNASKLLVKLKYLSLSSNIHNSTILLKRIFLTCPVKTNSVPPSPRLP